jgi:hypothetical protein
MSDGPPPVPTISLEEGSDEDSSSGSDDESTNSDSSRYTYGSHVAWRRLIRIIVIFAAAPPAPPAPVHLRPLALPSQGG